MASKTGPRTPLGKLRKRLREVEAELATAQAEVAELRKARTALVQVEKEQETVARIWALGKDTDRPENLSMRDMGLALWRQMRPKGTGYYVALHAIRAAVKAQHLSDEALARYRSRGSFRR